MLRVHRHRPYCPLLWKVDQEKHARWEAEDAELRAAGRLVPMGTSTDERKVAMAGPFPYVDLVPPTCCGVYRIFDHAGTLAYVGMSQNLRTRLRQHWNQQIKPCARWEVTVTPDVAAAAALEAELIRTLRPPFNVAGVDA